MGIGFTELIVLLLLMVVYFAPTLAARSNKHKDVKAIFMLNLFGGWLFVPWLIALVWAYKK